jgi:hypothetical protein
MYNSVIWCGWFLRKNRHAWGNKEYEYRWWRGGHTRCEIAGFRKAPLFKFMLDANVLQPVEKCPVMKGVTLKPGAL